MYSGPTPHDPLAQSNPLSINDVYFPAFERQVLPGPQIPQYGNQHDGGVPLDTQWDVYARRYDQCPDTIVFGVPNTGTSPRGNPLLYPYSELPNGFMPVFNNFSDWLQYSNPSRLITYVDDLQYQGIAPMELQPLVDAPEPWTIYTPQQRAGG